ncbi:hypothetical protein [Marinobacterium lutimaris]|uniref:Uncharacterized protein n=1 Tax=Marinobacterium lutimaris TaxID=568106 RepID=A0A1H6DRR5_9GAMM|nr:hypothetical protein [Marinobacterium lutimaris]SEG87386.1 hypothetical protein SAMN05444390_10875 [Marinobacterium lutimaris]
MGHIVRYVLDSRPAAVRRADTKPAVEVTQCSQCNYGDNYYGDQICLSRPAR